MSQVMSYTRPETVEEVVALLADGAQIVAGGTKANRNHNPFDGSPKPRALVDIQALGLRDIRVNGETATIQACVTLQEIADQDGLPSIVREAADREAPRTIRNAATIGGTIAAATATSEFLAALLIYGASVKVETSDGSRTITLAEALAEGVERTLITAVDLETSGRGAAGRVGRTPRDEPIVAAVGRQVGDNVTYAIAGVDIAPRLVDISRIEDLDPPADFRGSPEYRRHLATVLTARVAKELSQ